MTDTATELLESIRSFPNEDTPRLAYADLLDERAECETPRGEFIRVQCELARAPKYEQDFPACRACEGDGLATGPPECRPCRRCGGTGKEDSGGYKRVKTLLGRSAELLAAHLREWLKVPCATCGGAGFWADRCPDCRGGDAGGLTWELPGYFAPDETSVRIPHPDVTFARGFPHRVTVPLLACSVQRRCPGCNGIAVMGEMITCRCDVAWRPLTEPTPWLATVVRHHPTLAECVCLAPEPVGTPRGYYFHPTDVPDPLRTMTMSQVTDQFPTREAALTTLARRVVSWARSFK